MYSTTWIRRENRGSKSANQSSPIGMLLVSGIKRWARCTQRSRFLFLVILLRRCIEAAMMITIFLNNIFTRPLSSVTSYWKNCREQSAGLFADCLVGPVCTIAARIPDQTIGRRKVCSARALSSTISVRHCRFVAESLYKSRVAIKRRLRVRNSELRIWTIDRHVYADR